MSLVEIEEGPIVFRSVFINANGETETDIDDYYIINRDHLKEIISHIETNLREYRGATKIKTSWKYGETN